MIKITNDGHDYEASLSRGPEDEDTAVTIYCDDHWSGTGKLSAAIKIVDCPAQIPEEAYEQLEKAIQEALARGEHVQCDPGVH